MKHLLLVSAYVLLCVSPQLLSHGGEVLDGTSGELQEVGARSPRSPPPAVLRDVLQYSLRYSVCFLRG